MQYSALSAGMYHTSRLSVGVYRIVQSYVCKLIPYSACLRDYAIHLMSAGMYHTSRLSAGVCRTEPFLQVYAYMSCSASCTSCCYASVHTAQDCRKAGACCTYEPLACMSTTSYQIAGMWVCIIQSYVCRCIPYSAMSAGVHHAVLVCRCMPYSAMSAGMYRTSRYVCRCIPYSAVWQVYAYTPYAAQG